MGLFSMITKKTLAVSEEELIGFKTPENKLQFRIINNVSGSSILSSILIETEDSFLVAAPSRLISYEGELKIEPYVPVPFARFFKYTILSITPLFNEFELHYVKYLKENHDTLFNGLFNTKEIEYINQRYKELTQAQDTKEEQTTTREELPSPDSFMIVSESKYKH